MSVSIISRFSKNEPELRAWRKISRHLKRIVSKFNVSSVFFLAMGEYLPLQLYNIYFAYIYLDNARKATKLLNFITRNRKYILKQYREIECGLNTILTEFGSISAETDKICRLDNLAKRYQTLTGNILICRTNFVMNLIQFRSLEEALDRSCADDTDESVREIRAQLSKL